MISPRIDNDIVVNVIKDKLVEVRREACKDFRKFREYYFKDYHKFPGAEFHKEISELLADATVTRGMRLAIAAPRDSAKSTIVSLEYAIYCICFKFEDFIVIISSTYEQAVSFLGNIKSELETNRRLIEDFPNVCEINEKPKPERWTQKELITKNGVKIIALGTGQQLRGRRNREFRPSLIILDDVETSDTFQNPDISNKLEDWVTKSVLKSGTNRTNIIYVGTIHHYNSLLAKFTGDSDYPGWVKRIYKSIISWSDNIQLWEEWVKVFNRKSLFEDADGEEAAFRFFKKHEKKMLQGTKVLWPQAKSFYDLMVMREKEGYYSFDSEMQNDPVDPRNAIFMREETHLWTDKYPLEEDLIEHLRMLGYYQIFGACDPSMGRGGKHGNRSAIITIARDCINDRYYVLDADIAFRKPDQLINDILSYHARRNYMLFGFEVNQSQEFMAEVLRQSAVAQGIPLAIYEIRSGEDKIGRIQTLQPWVKLGTILFSSRHTNLHEEMRSFPKGRFNDGLDALQMAIETARNIVAGPGAYPAVVKVHYDKSDVLKRIDDVRGTIIPRVCNEPRDKFVPPGDGPRFIMLG